MKILDRPLDAACHTTIARACPPILFNAAMHLLVEVIHHDLGLEPDGVVVALDIARSFFCAFLVSNSGSSSTS
jgi:hypothetical protein